MESDAKVNILLVDDHVENLLALEAILEGLGQNLVRATSGEEALRCLLSQDFAVILLDVQMPEMDGFETATLIRQRVRSRHTPIIFLTAFSTNDALIFKGYSLGAVDYLFKPIDPIILTSKVNVFVDLFKKTAEIERQAIQLASINTELRQSEERFRSLSACSPVGVFLLDRKGQCTYTNPRCQAICGFTLEESLGEGWTRFLHPDDQERAIADWQQYTNRQQETSYEYRFQAPNGLARWTHVRSSPLLSDQGELLGHVGTIEDITERKQAEAVREQFIREQAARQQAEAANRMKDEFLAIVSHELRTPLNSILGWSRLLLNKTFDPDTTSRALEAIERNAKAQAQLIGDILDISQMIRGKLRLMIQPLNLMTLIEQVLETMHPLIATKELCLETQLDPLAQRVMGDSDRLRQIMTNLLSNAIKFTPDKGRLEVWLEQVEGDSWRNQETDSKRAKQPIYSPLPLCISPSASHYARLRITDTGVGISPEFLPYVFDRFRQADSTITRSYGGLGLGLAITHHLVTLHGGEIYADSEGEGKGATFTVYLPLAETQPSQNGTIEHQDGQTGDLPSLVGLQVLLVEDDHDSRELVTMILQQAGVNVTAVASVAEAAICLSEFNPQILISDIGLPEQDGYQLMPQLKEIEAQRGIQIPAIALTAYTRHEDYKRLMSAGFQAHLAKPVEPAKLLTTIVTLLEASDQANSLAAYG